MELKLGLGRGAIPHNAQELLAWSPDFRRRGKAQNSLQRGWTLKGNQLRGCGQGSGKIAVQVIVQIAANQMFHFRGRSAGLQIVGQRNDGEEDQNQHSESGDLHAGAGAQRVVCPPVLTGKPESEESGGKSYPEQIEEQLHNE